MAHSVMTEAFITGEGNPMGLAATELDAERSDVLAILAQHRQFLRYTTRDLTDEQARTRTTVSELTLGGLVKHVTDVERGWTRFIVEGPTALGNASEMSEADWARRADEFRLLDGETLAGVLDAYEATAAATAELVRTLPDLSATQPLPTAPWFPASQRWSARRALLHIIAETAQHSGHADIIRESLDGQKTMG
jgi:uncharacterized damage-inducible protein DinB